MIDSVEVGFGQPVERPPLTAHAGLQRVGRGKVDMVLAISHARHLDTQLGMDPEPGLHEAGAIERSGQQPLLVPGALENFKLTYAADFALAERLLSVPARSDR